MKRAPNRRSVISVILTHSMGSFRATKVLKDSDQTVHMPQLILLFAAYKGHNDWGS